MKSKYTLATVFMVLLSGLLADGINRTERIVVKHVNNAPCGPDTRIPGNAVQIPSCAPVVLNKTGGELSFL